MIDSIGGRKVAALLVMVALAVGAVVIKGDVPPNFLSLLEFLMGAFVLGNGVEHMAGAYASVNADTSEAPAPQAAAPAPVDLHPLLDAMGALQQGVNTTNQTLSFILQKTGLSAK